MAKIEKIRQIALKIRLRCEDYVGSRGYFASNLGSMCGIASYALKEALDCAHIDVILIYGFYEETGHCWLEYRDVIIDITATQFGVRRKVFITHCLNKRYKFNKVMTDMEEFVIDGWIENSCPNRELIDRILER